MMKEIKRPFHAQKALRVACLVLADLILINLSAFLALYIRFEFDFRQLYATTFLRDMLIYAGINSACTILIFHILKLYNSLWEFASVSELVRTALGCFFSAVFYMVGMFMLHLTVPRSFPAIYMLILCLLCGALRLSYRCVRRTRAGLRSEGEKRTMLIGGGQAGAIALREFQTSPRSENKVVCIIDDAPNKVGSYLGGVKIVGGRSAIARMAEKYDIDEIILAIPSASRQEKLQILNYCHNTSCTLRTLPGICQLANGEVRIEQIREVDIEDLLGRETVKIDLDEVAAYITGKTVLVTGGGGSIGSELCRQAAAQRPKRLIIFDIYENNAYDIQMELRRTHPELDLVVLIGSVRDRARVMQVFDRYRPDLVCHAAAHKHVPLMETSPFEAIKNNVFGTYNVAQAADRFGTQRFILISTDKAVNPTNVMGASKRLCEMIVQMINDRSATEYVAVRFGNVLGSAGSIIPLFRKQIRSGSVGARKVHDADTLKALCQADPSLIIQRLMTGDLDADVYIDTISHRAVSAFSKRKLETKLGGASKTVSFKDEALVAFIQQITQLLKFNGPVDMDFFFQDGVYYLSEINPRFGGAYLHAYGAGVDFVKLIKNNLNGVQNTPVFGNYEENVVMMMYDSVVITKLDKVE